MSSFTLIGDPITRHRSAVQLVASAGVAPPKEWTLLSQRLDAFLDRSDTPIKDRLAAAIIEGADPIEIAELRAAAVAESLGPNLSERVVRDVRLAVGSKLIEFYSKAAPGNYKRCADAFTQAAQKFSEAASRCDAEASSEAIVSHPDSVRDAWLGSEKHARTLDRLQSVLLASAELAGTYRVTSDELLIPLVLDCSAAHRRKLWQAWSAKGRCGHWAALAALNGVTIRACADLNTLEPYRQPKALQRKLVPTGERGKYTQVIHDPEDEIAASA